MNLKQEFLEALQAGRDYQALIEIVRRYLGQGMSSECAYELLQQIWLDFGYDDSTEESPMRDELEYVLERVWYQGSSVR